MEEKIQYLYRYRHLHGEHREWTRKILTDSIVHFANPSSFNDPFDCKIHYRSSFSMQELQRQHVSRIKRRITTLNRKQRRERVVTDIKSVKPEKFITDFTNSLQKSINKVGVLSLSATDQNILLWSHYAAGHTGLCLKFAATNHTPFFGCAQPVIYSDAYPNLSIVSSAAENVDAFLLTKACDWRYEQEYRIIDFTNGAGNRRFASELCVAVIFGARMAQADKEEVIEWTKSRKSCIELFEASIVPGAFSLEIKPYAAR
jgi:hypothetical protein